MAIDPLDPSEDVALNFYIEQASHMIEEILNRDFSYKTRVQTYRGSGTTKLLLRNRPVYPNPPAPYQPIQVLYDTNGFFGQSPSSFADSTTETLVYGQDYALQVDQDDGSSRSGILIALSDFWIKPIFREAGLLAPFTGDDTGSYQITYTAGHTVDTLPPVFRWACNLLVSRMRYLMPMGMEMGAESYEERAISILGDRKDYLLSGIKPVLLGYRNWKF